MDLGLGGRSHWSRGAYRGTGVGVVHALAAEGATVLVQEHEPGQADATVAAVAAVTTTGGTARVVYR